jgi:tRNA A-37 threonylcarbamoyl transferase component Bud32
VTGEALPVLQPVAIAAAGRELPAQFAISLMLAAPAPALPGEVTADGRVRLMCRQVLRLLPGRRLVARVEVAGRSAVIKLFLGARAERYCRREARGCAWMAAAGVTTPAVLAELKDPGGRGGGGTARALLFEYLPGARPVSVADDAGVAAAALQLARLHQAGCRHRDLHLHNFLELPDTGEVFVIDGDGVVRRSGAAPLDEGRSRTDLAVLCAQRPPLADGALPEVYRSYAAGRGWSDQDPAPQVALAAATRRQRRVRVRRYLKKAQRDCTEYRQQRTWRCWTVAVRDAWDSDLAAFVANPEAPFQAAPTLKSGHSATVIRAHLGSRRCVIKRYNLKGPWHAMRRVLKPTARFRRAWLNGQRLHFLGIPTARPLALVERRFGPVRGVAYLVMEDLGDRDLAGEATEADLSEPRLAQLVELFRALEAAGLVHGDTKASNFLITSDAVALVDLDAMHPAGRRGNRDLTRFLANFADRPALRERLCQAFAAAGLVAD